MAKKIGIIFNESESWAGGFYYLLNLIKALNKLPQQSKPILVVYFSDPAIITKVEELNYPGICFKPIKKRVLFWEKIIQWFTQKLRIKYDPTKYREKDVDIAFPNNYYATFPSLSQLKRLYWIPDFQHKHLPENFPESELEFREKQTQLIIDNGYSLIVSSKAACNDFMKFYPKSIHKVKVNTLPFCSILEGIAITDINLLKNKSGIQKEYYVSPNQFWKHKNHIVVLKALKHLKENNMEPVVYFTGNENGNEEYVNTLKSYIKKNDLTENVHFLGFLDRSTQLSLLKNSKAIIQPSRSEGWSTVVEDAKALNKFLILSNLEVHKEQVVKNGLFFDPTNELELADCIKKVENGNITFAPINYEELIIEFAKKIIALS